MATDVEIALQFTPRPIAEIAEKLGISHDFLNHYGRDIAKVDLQALTHNGPKPGRLILGKHITVDNIA